MPLDCEVLERFAAAVRAEDVPARSAVTPAGSGYLHERGVAVVGLDLPSRMIAIARQMSPEIQFEQGNMAALQVADNAWAGCVAFYSLIHFPPGQIVLVLHKLHRVLKPGGLLFLAFHQGHEVRHIDEWWGKQVVLDGFFFARADMEGYMRQAGFRIERSLERAPYEGVEVATQRAYIFARKPS